MTTLETVAKKLNVNSAWLWSLIQFESRANPAARNPISGARGLIQFLHSTARELGYKDADDLVDKNPTFDKQLAGPVFKYLAKYAPFSTPQSLYMAVFYPKARTWQPSRMFPAAVIDSNPGIYTVQDYINHVEGKGKGKIQNAIGFLVLAAIAAIAAIGIHLSGANTNDRL
jgi:soluble lytic murein transglycosylase-like protein